MIQALEPLPVSTVIEPTTAEELATTVRESYEVDRAVYPIGGATSLDFGCPPKKQGIGLKFGKLNQVLDYPARDLTVTVEAGITMKALAELLSKERQRFPIDVPRAEQATLGGVVATNFNGPLRFGQGTVRDYVIGIHAVDGRGIAFKGGGRVVKNVAGYDFCKLLTGSLGTLGVITQLTLKLRPMVERMAFLVCAPANEAEAERILAALVNSRTAPACVELLAGKQWAAHPAFASLSPAHQEFPYFIAVAVEGTDIEVRWMAEQLGREWWDLRVGSQQTLFDRDAEQLLQRCIEFPAEETAALVLKASVVPSKVTSVIVAARKVDSNCAILSHAGNGIVIIRLSQPPVGGMTKGLIGTLQTAAANASGSLVVLSGASGSEATQRSIWGSLSAPLTLLSAVKRAFDPRNILNPDRIGYAGY